MQAYTLMMTFDGGYIYAAGPTFEISKQRSKKGLQLLGKPRNWRNFIASGEFEDSDVQNVQLGLKSLKQL